MPVSIVRNNQTPEGSNYLNFDESLVGPSFDQSYIGKDLNESYIGQGLDDTYIGHSLDESKVGPNEENPLPKRRKKEIKTSPSIECNICHEKFPSKSKWKNHMVMVHDNKKPFECEYCGHGSSTEANLNK